MLVLKYDSVEAGAPSQYGDATDWLRDGQNTALQGFPKAAQGFFPAEKALSDALDAWLAARGPTEAPVIVMVHGYQFDPNHVPAAGTSPDSPLTTIYGQPPAVDYHLSWLPLVGECDKDGGARAENAIAFCYRSESGLLDFAAAGWVNSYQYAAMDQSPLAARALATILVALSAKVPKMRILAHSLGTRTTSQAIRIGRARLANTLDRVVLLDGAEFSVDAAASFINCPFDVFSFTNRTDQVLRIGGDQACHPVRMAGTAGACSIGYDGLGGNDRWLDLQLDNPALVAWFASGQAPDGLPYQINAIAEEESHPSAGLDHWCCYTNDGNRALVRDLLFNDLMTVERMKAHGVPAGTSSPIYGQFNGQPIPPTPQSRMDRQRLLSNVDLAGGGG